MPQKKLQHDYDELSREIEQEVRQAVDAMGAALRGAVNGAQASFGSGGMHAAGQAFEGAARAAGQALGGAAKVAAQEFEKTVRPTRKAMAKNKRLKKLRSRRESAAIAAGGHLCMGALFTALSATAFLEEGWTGVPVLAVFAAWGFVSGLFKLRKARRLRFLLGYMTALEDRSYCRISELAAATSRREKAVLADIRRFLQMGEMEGMYLSPDDTRLFTNRTAYMAYMAHVEYADQPAPDEDAAPTAGQVYENFLRELAAEKQRMDDAAVRAKVEKLEQHTVQIAEWLRQHPGREAGVRRFTGYYLPTVLKLLRTYNDMDLHTQDSGVANGIQQEIGDILDTIDKAFVTLRDGLLQDTAMDVSAEISALETVLAQDGLVEDKMAK